MPWKLLSPRRSTHSTRCLSVLAILFTLELTTRLFSPNQVQRFQFDPDVGYLFRPHFDRIYTDRESSNTYRLTTNSLGFRGPEWAIPKPDNVRRIALLGNSFVESRAYPDDQTFAGLLSARLNSSPTDGIRWEVMNFGLGGNNTPGELLIYNKFVRPFEPDIVLLCASVANDLNANSRTISGRPTSVFCDFDSSGRIQFSRPVADDVREFRNLSRLYVWQKNQVQELINRLVKPDMAASLQNPAEETKRVKLASAARLTRQPLEAPFAESWDLYERLLSIFRDSVEADGAEFLVVNLPEAWQVHESMFVEMARADADPDSFDLRDPEVRLAALAEKRDFRLLDLTNRFREEAERHPQSDRLFLRGIGHFSQHGHEVTADGIFDFLTRHSLRFRYDARQLAEQPSETLVR